MFDLKIKVKDNFNLYKIIREDPELEFLYHSPFAVLNNFNYSFIFVIHNILELEEIS